MEGNFGGGKRWRIWRITVGLPNLFQQNFIQLKKVSRDKITLMSTLKYFNCTPTIVQDEGLPEPTSTSSLSNFVPPKTIELANTEVEKVKNKGPQGARSAPYLILTPAQTGLRWVKEHGVTSQIYRVA